MLSILMAGGAVVCILAAAFYATRKTTEDNETAVMWSIRAGIFAALTAVCLAGSAIAAEPYRNTADYYTQAFLGGKPYIPAVECGRKCK